MRCLTKTNSTAIFVVPKQIIQGNTVLESVRNLLTLIVQGNTVVESIRNLLTLILDGPEGV